MTKAAILNSRQSKRPVGTDEWVVNSINAVKFCNDNNYTIISSIGMNTYELVTYAASKYDAKIILILFPSPNPDELINEVVEDFKLNREKTGFFYPNELRNFRKSDYIERDKLLISNSDIVLPVSLNKKGNLSSLVKTNEIHTIEDFRTSYPGKKISYKEDYSKFKIREWAYDDNWNYLTHWTRTCNTNWQGETKYDYYDAIINSEEYPHSALHTLHHILKGKLLRASSKHLHRGVNAVAFSELKPSDVVPLMKWRPRLVSMSFEPYGIAIDKEVAVQIGIRKVLYGSPEMYDILKPDEKPFFHSMGEFGDWMPEKEHRFLGDLNLNDIPSDKLKIIVKNEREIPKAQLLTESEVLPLLE